jgi:hypothetical protein
VFRVLLFCLAIVGTDSFAQESKSAPITRGFVLLDGVEIPHPFVLTQDADGISLSGHVLDFPSQKRGHRGPPEGMRRKRGMHQRPRAGQHSLGQFESLLRLDSLILLSADGPSQLISPPRSLAAMDILSSSASEAEKLEALSLIHHSDQGSAAWREVVTAFVPTPELATRLKEAHTRHPSRTPTASSHRVNNALSIFGFLLAVAALGTLLLHRPDTVGGIRGVNPEPLAMRRVLQAGLLLGALAIYDLVATLTLVQSGLVVEVNPIARGFIQSPIATTIFKLGLTGVAIAGLVAMRRHRPAQVAAWWACVINTVLLLRWATVTSTIV